MRGPAASSAPHRSKVILLSKKYAWTVFSLYKFNHDWCSHLQEVNRRGFEKSNISFKQRSGQPYILYIITQHCGFFFQDVNESGGRQPDFDLSCLFVSLNLFK